MIDTVTIRAPFGELLPGMNHEQELQWLDSWDIVSFRPFKRWKRNPTSSEKQSGHYYPQLTAYRERTHNWRLFVKIQFSVPKLCLGNNLDELADQQLVQAVGALQQSLARVGFNPSQQVLLRAEVVNLHYSKNIVLRDDYKATELIGYLRRIQVTGRLHKRDTQYRRGSGINLYNKAFGFSIYDKMAELDQNLADSIVLNGAKPEVLRLEVRMETKKKLNHTFEKLGLRINPTFREVFDSAKSSLVVTHFWETLIKPQIAVITDGRESVITLAQHLLRGKPGLKPNKALKIGGLVLAGRDSGGLSELKTIILNRQSSRTWYSLNREIKEANEILATIETNWWEQIDIQLDAYEPVFLTQN